MDQTLHDTGIRQGRDVPHIAGVVLGDLSQDAAHDLPGAGLGQGRGELDGFGRGDGTYLRSHVLDQFLLECLRLRDPFDQGDIGIESLSFDLVGDGADRGLGHLVMTHEGAFDLGGTDAVAGDIDHVVDAAHEPEVTVFVLATTVAGKIDIIVHREVGVDEPIVITPHGPHHAGPGLHEAEFAAFIDIALRPVVAENPGVDPKEGFVDAARFERVGTRQGGNHDAACLGLPPGVDDGTLAAADLFRVPHPGLRVDRLTHGAEDTEGVELVLCRPLIAQPHEGPNRRRGGVEDGDGKLVADLPKPAGVRIGGHALEHQRGGPVGQRAVDDIAVTGDPTDVRRAPVHIIFVDVKDDLMRQTDMQEITAGGMDDALGLAGGTGGVEDKERILGRHRLRLALLRGIGHFGGIPEIPSAFHGTFVIGDLDHHTGLDGGALGQGLVDDAL